MGEAKRTGPHGGLYGEGADLAFIRAWFRAEDHADVEFTDRMLGDGSWVVLARIGSGATQFTALLTPVQCRAIADRFAAEVGKPDFEPIVQLVTDLIVALRAAADEMERLHKDKVKSL